MNDEIERCRAGIAYHQEQINLLVNQIIQLTVIPPKADFMELCDDEYWHVHAFGPNTVLKPDLDA